MQYRLAIIGLFLVVFIGFGVYLLTLPIVRINGHRIVVSVADSPAELTKGLSGRSSLSEDSGMLFVFPRPQESGIWMKDMRFAIDVLWLDDSRHVVHIVKDLQPDSYPTAYYSQVPAAYVLELPAGSVQRYDITEGQLVTMRY